MSFKCTPSASVQNKGVEHEFIEQPQQVWKVTAAESAAGAKIFIIPTTTRKLIQIEEVAAGNQTRGSLIVGIGFEALSGKRFIINHEAQAAHVHATVTNKTRPIVRAKGIFVRVEAPYENDIIGLAFYLRKLE